MPTPDSSDPRLRLATVYELKSGDLDDHPSILLRSDPEEDDNQDDEDDEEEQDLPPVTPVGTEDFFLDLSPNERPTIPVPVPPPRDSGIRLAVTRVPIVAATVDAVLCDLSRDPRSETWSGEDDARSEESGPPTPTSSQNERPPSTSIVRALK